MAGHGAHKWLAFAVLAITFSGCSGTQTQNGAGAGFPVRVAAVTGSVTIPRAPKRIVSLSPTGTEDLYAVGAGKQVVAVDSYSNYPSQAPRSALSGYTPNVEAVAKYRPDLVVVGEDTGNIVAQLQKLQVPVLLEPPAKNLDGLYSEITQLGQATGHSDGAAPIIQRIKQQIADIVRSVPRPNRRLTVYHELDQTYFSANSQTFIGQMYSLLGLTNIADKAHGSNDYPQLSAEYVIGSDPDLIVLADTICCKQSAATVRARPGWANIVAVKNGDVLPIDDTIASEWGPRIVVFLKAVADAQVKLEKEAR